MSNDELRFQLSVDQILRYTENMQVHYPPLILTRYRIDSLTLKQLEANRNCYPPEYKNISLGVIMVSFGLNCISDIVNGVMDRHAQVSFYRDALHLSISWNNRTGWQPSIGDKEFPEMQLQNQDHLFLCHQYMKGQRIGVEDLTCAIYTFGIARSITIPSVLRRYDNRRNYHWN